MFKVNYPDALVSPDNGHPGLNAFSLREPVTFLFVLPTHIPNGG